MNDVKSTLLPLEWTTVVQKVDRNSPFPMVVKPTAATAETYQITEDPVLLHNFWVTQRLTAQSLEDEGAYVVGPQMEIPSEYTGTFLYRSDMKGNTDVVQMFGSVKDISMSMPEKVFPQERIVVYPTTAQDYATTTGEKVKSLILQPREQLTVIEKKEIYTVLPTSRFAFSGKPKYKFVAVPCVTFMVELTKETINLPLYTKGKFCTLSHIPSQGREFDFKDILNEIDLPINLTTCRNCPQTLLDEHFLRPGLRLRMTALEEYEIILGVTTHETIVEFAAEDVEFILPKHLNVREDKEQEIVYQTAVQRFLMECQIKNSPVNIRDYRKSIRNHVSRSVRPSAPKALSQVASNRVYKYSVTQNQFQNGMPLIALLSANISPNNLRRASLPTDGQRSQSQRHAMPLPAPPSPTKVKIPPLPPRNSRSGSSLRISDSMSSTRPISAREISTTGLDQWNDFPSRPPPPPPGFPPERPKSSSTDSSTNSSGEQIWETLDENCLKRLREERKSLKKDKRSHSAYENLTTDFLERETTDSSTSVPNNVTNDRHAIHILEQIERPVSPEFALSVTSTSVLLTTTVTETSMTSVFPTPIITETSMTSVLPTLTVTETSMDPSLFNDLSLGATEGPTHPREEEATAQVQVATTVESHNYENFVPLQRNGPVDDELKTRHEEGSQLQQEIFAESSKNEGKNGDSTEEEENTADSPEQEENIADSQGEKENIDESPVRGVKPLSLTREISMSSTSSMSKSDEEEPERTHSASPKESPLSSRSSSKLNQQNNGFYRVSRYSVVSDDSSPSQHVSFTCNYVPSPDDWTPPCDLSEMSVSEVSNALRYIGMNEDTVEWFRAEKVDGHLLCSIEDEVFTQHFRLTPFQQKKMVMFLKGWRPKLK